MPQSVSPHHHPGSVSQPWFATWFSSLYYPLLYNNRNEQEAKDFIDTVLRRLALPIGSRVLDLACGRGRHARHLAQQPLVVWGYDLSAESIAEAVAQGRENLHFRVHDMRQPLPDAPFAAIFNLFTSFGYFDSMTENAAVLRNISVALQPGGWLVLDYFNTPQVLASLVARETVMRGDIRFEITRELRNGKIVKDIHVFDGGQSFRFEEVVQAIAPADFARLLHESGFGIVEKWGSYQGDSYDEEKSKRCILFCKKL